MRTLFFLPLILLAVILTAGCQNDPYPIESGSVNPGQFYLPEGATLQSADLVIYVRVPNGQTVNIHRVTSEWNETSVTWDNFNAAYDATIVNSFVADEQGWHSIPVTSLVQDWLNGTYPNFGLILDQTDKNFPRAYYYSRETSGYEPYLRICYEIDSDTRCDQGGATADAYIWEANATTNYGTAMLLYTGWEDETDLEKQSLLAFDVEYNEMPDDGCTWCKGCWRNHSGLDGRDDWITQYLPIILGNTGGQCSINVDNVDFARQLLGMELYDNPTNGIIHLYAQLLTTKLNIAYGASDEVIADVVALADDFLATHCWEDWYELTKPEQRTVFEWQKTLDDYNSGRIGPGHCPCVCDAPCDNL